MKLWIIWLSSLLFYSNFINPQSLDARFLEAIKYLGAYYQSDVLAGAIIGAGSAVLSHQIEKMITRKHFQSLIG